MLDLVLEIRCEGCGRVVEERFCRDCRAVGAHRLAPEVEGLDGLWVLDRYDGPLGRAIRVTKYRPDRHLGLALATLLARRIVPVLGRTPPDAIVPVPSPWTRRLTRGFSLSALLADALGDALGVAVVPALRLKPGRRQAGRSGTSRQLNLKGRVRAVVDVPGRVLLVDDVLTTGATAAACARELLGGQSERVGLTALCIASPTSRNPTVVQKA